MSGIQKVGSVKFRDKFTVWKQNLLDMSHRNRQLYFKPGSRNAIEIVHPHMYWLFNELVIKDKRFIFPPVFEPAAVLKEPDETDETYRKRLNELHAAAIKEKISLANRRFLITKTSDKLLQRLMKKIERRAKTSFEEQGVNILFLFFGLLKWYDVDNQKRPVHSPLLFVPVRLYRKRVLDDYRLQIQEDEVVLNPSLQEKFKKDFKTTLPEFPESFSSNSLLEYVENIRNLIKKYKDWELFERSYVGLFSFAKNTMYQDLETNTEKIWNHRIIRAIAEGEGYIEDPKNIPEETLYSDEAEPQVSYHILDCDSSQFKAITFAKKGASMVIRGPPGTGKSQTISNIIAECLSVGKKVLFVAEKRAALDVVKKRLDKCGVGEFCLELHSEKSNKMDVLNQISRSIACELNSRTYKRSKFTHLRTQRLRLNEYVNNIHTPLGAANDTLFEKIGEYQKLNHLPLITTILRRPLDFTDEALYEIEDLLEQLDSYKQILLHYDENPWAKSGFLEYKVGMKAEVYDDLRELENLCLRLSTTTSEFMDRYGLHNIHSQEDVKTINDYFKIYNEHSMRFDPDSLLDYTSSVKVFNAAFQAAKRELKRSLRGKSNLSLEAHATEIKKIQEHYQDSVNESYKGITEDFDSIAAAYQKIETLKLKLSSLLKNCPLHQDEPNEWRKYLAISKYWLKEIESFDGWLSVQLILQKLRKLNVDDFVLQLRNNPILEEDTSLYDIFIKSFTHAWIINGMDTFSNLTGFNDKYISKIKSKFIELDQDTIKLNRYRLCEKLFEERPSQFWITDGIHSSEYSILAREMAKKRNIKPLRTILSLTKNLVTRLKPCFMMSPLSVAKYLPIENFSGFFDVVVFDEASQVCPEDAVGAILRGTQLIVVGDEKQLPPTKFFAANLTETFDDLDTDVFDSILEECTGIGLPIIMLNYHYRSKKEGLIAFSNFHFYDNNLYTFPDVVKQGTQGEDVTELSAIEYHYIENGVYDRARTRRNKAEADTVAQYIVKHYEMNEKNNTHYSLGVIAFSEAQQTAIIESLDKIYKSRPDLEDIVKSYDEEPLFIKNLENVQGDERDFIIFSIGYGKDNDGKMVINFGPVNKSGGERRLNVAITRARYHVKIFCSFMPYEADISKSSSIGLNRLIEYLEFARTNRLTVDSIETAIDIQIPPSALEESLKNELEKLGYTVDQRVGKSKFQIDLAIVHPDYPYQYIIGLECDGGSYQRTDQARDRERIRASVLKSLGWDEYIHVYSPLYFSDPQKIIKEIEKTIKKIQEEQSAALVIPDTEPMEIQSDEIDVEFTIKEGNPQETPVSDKSEKTIDKFRKQYTIQPNVVDYIPYVNQNILPVEEFNKIRNRQKAANEIIEAEGPIHWELLQKRIKEHFGIKRMTENVQDKMEELFDSIEMTGDFYYPKKYKSDLIRVPAGVRKFHQISDIELKNAMQMIISNSVSVDKDELFLRTVQLFGFPSRRKQYVERLIELLNELLTKAAVPVDSVRGHEYAPPVPEIELAKISDEELENIDIEQLIAEMEEVGLINGETEEKAPVDYKEIMTTKNLLDVFANGEMYEFEDLIAEFDIEDEAGVRLLAAKLQELFTNELIEIVEKDNESFWKLKS
jgi:hypothetical protein